MTSPLATEFVVLLDDSGTPIGQHDKATVHSSDTPLHLAFSCHVFNSEGLLLVTRRALSKKAWPGVWTNSFCGHPGPGESVEEAIFRRAKRELNIQVLDVRSALPDFRYRAVDASGVVENEICPVFTATTASVPSPADDEVVEYFWADPVALVDAVTATPWAFSPWLTLQLPALAAAGLLNR